MIEEFLLCRTGNPKIVDAFHRFVYGFSDPISPPELRINGASFLSGGWQGPFWDPPDLWVRNEDDGGTQHQSPKHGKDNWLHVRVKNMAGTGAAQHFVVSFHARGFAGTAFSYPTDFLPCIAARAEFDLGAGDTRIVKVMWSPELVPVEGSHTCLLASVVSRADHPDPGRHVGEHNNLAQNNLTVVDMLPKTFIVVPVVIANPRGEGDPEFNLEVVMRRQEVDVNVSLVHRSKKFFELTKIDVRPFKPAFTKEPTKTPEEDRLECGGHSPGLQSMDKGRVMRSDTPNIIMSQFPESWVVELPKGGTASLPVKIPPLSQRVIGLKVAVPAQANIRQSFTLDLVQRHSATGKIAGGIAVQVNVINKT
jgi:hypothetical protein